MASKIWLLVEWIQNANNMFLPSYGVVKVKTSAYDPSELSPGNEILLRTKHSKAQAAKIIRISENKPYINDHRNFLERQNEHFKALMKCCIQEIRDMKTENNSLNLTMKSPEAHHSRDRRATPQIVVANLEGESSDSECEVPGASMYLSRDRRTTPQILMASHGASSSDTDSDADSNVNRSRSSNRIKGKYSRQKNRKESKVHKCVPRVTSTPLTIKHGQNVTIHYHQGTQTEAIFLQPNVEALENSMKILYKQFLNLLSKLSLDCDALENGIDESSDETATDFNHYEYDVLTEHNVSVTSSEPISPEYEREVRPVVNVGAEAVNDGTGSDEPLNAIKASAIIGPSSSRSNVSNTHAPKVRKISGQSSNSTDSSSVKMSHDKDLAPIGNGYAKVPFRLLNGIDWTSHTTATRHLLQAVFPRSVLATHCLTGKTSPAFMNRPPKKILDPKLVEDIVNVVSTRCNVPKNLVRNTITIKCTDESKLYRNRQQCKLQRRANENEENTPPVAPPADDVAMNEN